MKDIELPSLPTDMMLQSDGEWVRTEKNTLTATEAKAYARAAVEADRAQRVPDDFLSHKSAWRAAIVIAQGFSANEDDSAYWSHEIKAFDMAYARLLASTPAQPAQQDACDCQNPVFCSRPCALTVTPPARQERQIAEALRRHGLALVKKASGYDVIELGPATAQHQEPPQQERKRLTGEQASAMAAYFNVPADYVHTVYNRVHGIKE